MGFKNYNIYSTFRMLQHTFSEVTVKTITQSLFSFPSEIEMAEEQKYL